MERLEAIQNALNWQKEGAHRAVSIEINRPGFNQECCIVCMDLDNFKFTDASDGIINFDRTQ